MSGEYLYVVHLDNLPLSYEVTREDAYRTVFEVLTVEERERADVQEVPVGVFTRFSEAARYVYEEGGLEGLVRHLNHQLHEEWWDR